MTYAIVQPYKVFADANGLPLEAGFIYIGQPNQNPEVYPLTAYWDDAISVTAAQPIRTMAGFPKRNGTPSNIYTATDYSITIRDKNGALVFSAPMSSLIGSAAQVSFTQSGVGAVATTVQAELSKSVNVFQFMTSTEIANVQARNYGSDVTTAIRNAIAYVAANGGDVLFPNGTYYITGTLILGNASGATWSTDNPIRLKGMGAPAGLGNPVGGVQILSNWIGPAIQVNGPVSGWGIEDMILTSASTSGTDIGIQIVSGQAGTLRNVGISNYRGIALDMQCSAYGATTQNIFERLTVYMPSSGSAAVGVKLNGSGTYNSTANTFINLSIQPTLTTHTCLLLAYCDTNNFINTILGGGYATPNGILFDYTVNTSFPCTNTFFQLATELNKINIQGTPASYAYTSTNKIYAFGQDSTVNFPNVANLTLAFDRIKLVQNQTFYVKNDGSNTTGSGLIGNNWKTLQYAYDTICKYYDLNGYTVTIELLDANYTEGALNAAAIPHAPSGSCIVIKGQSGGTTMSYASACINAAFGVNLLIQNISFASSAGAGALTSSGKVVVSSGCTFAASSVPHIYALNGGLIQIVSGYTVSGGTNVHWIASAGGSIVANSITVTTSGTPAFSTAFAYAYDIGLIECIGNTYSGTGATGSRYNAYLNAVINTGTANVNTLPGNAAGATSLGGQYN
jgi:hypothetical protein